MQQFKALVAEHQLLAGSFRYLHLELVSPNRIEFQAGQYVILTIDSAKGIRRDYSIASPPSMDHAIELLVDVKPKGPGSTYLRNLKIGDQVEFVGPFGNFIVKDSYIADQRVNASTHQLLFVATGSGISPTRSMILDLLITKKCQAPIRLWWGMRYQEDCFWGQDFDQLAEQHPNFQWDLVLSKPPEDWPLHKGYTTTYVFDYVKNKEEGRGKREEGKTSTPEFCFYLCGNQHMITDALVGLRSLGINNDQIHHEKFF